MSDLSPQSEPKRTLMIQIVVTNCDFMSTRPRRPHAFEQLVDRCLVRHRPYLRRLRLRLLHREQVDHLAPAPHRLVLRQHAGVGAVSAATLRSTIARFHRIVRCICSRQQVAPSGGLVPCSSLRTKRTFYRAWWVMAAITALGLIPTFLLIRPRLPRVRDDQEAANPGRALPGNPACRG
jgi:hypothetical protein